MAPTRTNSRRIPYWGEIFHIEDVEEEARKQEKALAETGRRKAEFKAATQAQFTKSPEKAAAKAQKEQAKLSSREGQQEQETLSALPQAESDCDWEEVGAPEPNPEASEDVDEDLHDCRSTVSQFDGPLTRSECLEGTVDVLQEHINEVDDFTRNSIKELLSVTESQREDVKDLRSTLPQLITETAKPYIKEEVEPLNKCVKAVVQGQSKLHDWYAGVQLSQVQLMKSLEELKESHGKFGTSQGKLEKSQNELGLSQKEFQQKQTELEKSQQELEKRQADKADQMQREYREFIEKRTHQSAKFQMLLAEQRAAIENKTEQRLGKMETALQEADNAIKNELNSAADEIRLSLAEVMESTNDHGERLELLEKQLIDSPEDDEAFFKQICSEIAKRTKLEQHFKASEVLRDRVDTMNKKLDGFSQEIRNEVKLQLQADKRKCELMLKDIRNLIVADSDEQKRKSATNQKEFMETLEGNRERVDAVDGDLDAFKTEVEEQLDLYSEATLAHDERIEELESSKTSCEARQTGLESDIRWLIERVGCLNANFSQLAMAVQTESAYNTQAKIELNRRFSHTAGMLIELIKIKDGSALEKTGAKEGETKNEQPRGQPEKETKDSCSARENLNGGVDEQNPGMGQMAMVNDDLIMKLGTRVNSLFSWAIDFSKDSVARLTGCEERLSQSQKLAEDVDKRTKRREQNFLRLETLVQERIKDLEERSSSLHLDLAFAHHRIKTVEKQTEDQKTALESRIAQLEKQSKEQMEAIRQLVQAPTS